MQGWGLDVGYAGLSRGLVVGLTAGRSCGASVVVQAVQLQLLLSTRYSLYVQLVVAYHISTAGYCSRLESARRVKAYDVAGLLW